jgi:hypothetical protein
MHLRRYVSVGNASNCVAVRIASVDEAARNAFKKYVSIRKASTDASVRNATKDVYVRNALKDVSARIASKDVNVKIAPKDCSRRGMHQYMWP